MMTYDDNEFEHFVLVSDNKVTKTKNWTELIIHFTVDELTTFKPPRHLNERKIH